MGDFEWLITTSESSEALNTFTTFYLFISLKYVCIDIEVQRGYMACLREKKVFWKHKTRYFTGELPKATHVITV